MRFFFLLLVTVVLSFVFGKNCPIMDYLVLKDSSRQLHVNCVISYSFYLHLMLHLYAARFDVTSNLRKFLDFGWDLNRALIWLPAVNCGQPIGNYFKSLKI